MEANENSNVDNDSNNKMEAKVKNIRELYASLIKYTLQFFKEVIFLYIIFYYIKIILIHFRILI